MKHARTLCLISVVAVALLCCASAQASAWLPTAGGTAYDWNNAANWTGGVPNGVGAVADLNVDLAGAQTVRLQASTTVGQLNLGDSAATAANYGTTFSSGTGTNTLTFQAAPGGTAQLNLAGTGTTINTISAPVALASDLAYNAAGGQVLATSGAFNIGANSMTLTGSALQRPQWTITGDLQGSGTITYSGLGGITVGGVKTFTGTVVLNSGYGGTSNHGSMALTTGSLKDAAEIVVNGYLSAGTTQNGGSLHAGNSSAAGSNPGQRVTQNTVTLNSGTLSLMGQSANTDGTTPWRSGQEMVSETVNSLHVNSGYSLLNVGASTTTLGNRLNITTVDREQGASMFLKSATLGTTARVLAANSASLAIGGGGAEGTVSMSIIPWMVGANTNAYASASSAFATYVNGVGFRALNATEWAGDLTVAGADYNMNTSSYSIVGAKTINALQHNSSGASGFNNTINLTIASGGLSFNLNNGGIGNQDVDTENGTVNFGAAEGVVWAIGTNVNTLSAKLTGTGGLTKAGTGTLILKNNLNAITGKTVVGAGILQVGDATNTSNLGVGDVEVAQGAILKLVNDAAISDAATVNLIKNGLFNGRLEIAAGLNETIGGLILGGVAMTNGTYSAVAAEGVDFVNADYFAGSGIVTVVPEPATMAVLLMGGMAVVIRRKRA